MMKKAVKIPIIVVSAVVALILIAVIVMCAITIRPMKNFMDYDTVWVTTTEHTLPDVPLSDPDGKYRGEIDKNLKKTGFSVMHATLEFVGSYGPEFVTEKDADDKDVKVEKTVSQAISACAATDSSYKLQLHFPEARTIEVEGETVKFDNLVMNVASTGGELRWVTVYLYLDEFNGAQNQESYDYRITPIKLRMNTSPLYNTLGTIAADYKN